MLQEQPLKGHYTSLLEFTMNRDHLISRFKQILNSVPAVYAYIAGSFNTPFHSPNSDIDLVVIWEDEPTMEQRNKFMSLLSLNANIEWAYFDAKGSIVRDAIKFADFKKTEIYHHTFTAFEYALQTQYSADGLAYSINNRVPLILNDSMEEYINSYQRKNISQKQDIAFSIVANFKNGSTSRAQLSEIIQLYALTQWNSIPAQKHWDKIVDTIPKSPLLLLDIVIWLTDSIGLILKWGEIMPSPVSPIFENSYIKKYSPQTESFVFSRVSQQRNRLQQYLNWPQKIKALEDQQAFSLQADSQWNNGLAFHFQIFSTDHFQGAVSIHSLNYQERSFEFGYWVDQVAEGKGFISRGLEVLMTEMKLSGWKTAKIRTISGNIKSQRVAARIGMSLSGVDGNVLFYEKRV